LLEFLLLASDKNMTADDTKDPRHPSVWGRAVWTQLKAYAAGYGYYVQRGEEKEISLHERAAMWRHLISHRDILEYRCEHCFKHFSQVLDQEVGSPMSPVLESSTSLSKWLTDLETTIRNQRNASSISVTSQSRSQLHGLDLVGPKPVAIPREFGVALSVTHHSTKPAREQTSPPQRQPARPRACSHCSQKIN
jgi:hypothetical protein